jgi:hypothetical protein
LGLICDKIGRTRDLDGPHKEAATMSRKIARTATEGLKHLWEESFFQSPKMKDPIVDAFAKRGNHFADAELGMALMRAPYLTRRGKRGSYEYIQKHPFILDEQETTGKTKGGKK